MVLLADGDTNRQMSNIHIHIYLYTVGIIVRHWFRYRLANLALPVLLTVLFIYATQNTKTQYADLEIYEKKKLPTHSK